MPDPFLGRQRAIADAARAFLETLEHAGFATAFPGQTVVDSEWLVGVQSLATMLETIPEDDHRNRASALTSLLAKLKASR